MEPNDKGKKKQHVQFLSSLKFPVYESFPVGWGSYAAQLTTDISLSHINVPLEELSWSFPPEPPPPSHKPRGHSSRLWRYFPKDFWDLIWARMGFPHHLPTFEEGVCCNGKERQLKHKLAKQEGFKPHWGVLQQRVFEFFNVPLQQVSQLEKIKITMNTTTWQGRRSRSNPLGSRWHNQLTVKQPRWSFNKNSLALTQMLASPRSFPQLLQPLCATQRRFVTPWQHLPRCVALCRKQYLALSLLNEHTNMTSANSIILTFALSQ